MPKLFEKHSRVYVSPKYVDGDQPLVLFRGAVAHQAGGGFLWEMKRKFQDYNKN